LIAIASAQMLGVVIPGVPHIDFGGSLIAFITGLIGLVAKDGTVTGT